MSVIEICQQRSQPKCSERHAGNSSRALIDLESTRDYYFDLSAAYVRGEAYLMNRNAEAAAAEFQRLLSHRGVVGIDVEVPLAHLQIGRAYAMRGDTAKAKAAYKDFLTLWKDADPDIPIQKQAKAEYAKLQ
jgi:lipopolysaccharide biosynthesis regulator YciM